MLVRIIFTLLLIVLTLSVSAGNWGTEVIPVISDKGVIIQIKNAPLPMDLLSHEIDSGLPNNIVYLLSFFSGDQALGVKTVKYMVIHDLWDENYRLEKNLGDKTVRQVYKEKGKLLKKLSGIEIKGFDAALLGNEYILRIQTVFNPIKIDRVKEVKDWFDGRSMEAIQRNKLAEASSGPQTFGTKGADVTQISRGPRFKKLFNKILEQYAENSESVGQWRSKLVTVNFKLPEITDEE